MSKFFKAYFTVPLKKLTVFELLHFQKIYMLLFANVSKIPQKIKNKEYTVQYMKSAILNGRRPL